MFLVILIHLLFFLVIISFSNIDIVFERGWNQENDLNTPSISRSRDGKVGWVVRANPRSAENNMWRVAYFNLLAA